MNPTPAGAATDETVRIEGALTIQTGERWLTHIAAFLATAPVLRIDLAAATEFDSIGLQLLVAARRSAERRGKRCELLAPPAVLTSMVAAIGLDLAAPPAGRSSCP